MHRIVMAGTVYPAAAPAAPKEEWAIEPRGRNLSARLREVWQYRRLFRYFGQRSVERLYKGTALGMAWLFLRPLLPLTVRTIVFGGLLNVKSPGVPYFLFLLVGSAAWELFAGCLMWATRSFQINRSFLGRMYFPRVILPAAAMAPAFVNFLIMLAVMTATLIYYYFSHGRLYMNAASGLIWAVAALLVAVTLALGIGLFTSVLNAEYRDVRFTLTFVLEFWALVTPILYPLSAVPEKWRWLVLLNPLAGVVQAFKWGVLGIEEVNGVAFGIEVLIVFAVLLCGLWYFGRAEANAVDRI